MKKYNIFAENKVELSKIQEESSCSYYAESSTFLRSAKVPEPPTKHFFNFIEYSRHDIMLSFYVTISRKKFQNIYYGYDSTSFCLVRSTYPLAINRRYIIYGRLSKARLYFLDSTAVEELDYKAFCYSLV